MSTRTSPTARPGAAPHELSHVLRGLPRRLLRALVRRCTLADPRAAARIFIGTFAVAIALSLVLPAAAQADIGDLIEKAIQNVLGSVFERIMSGLFGRIQGEVTEALVSWLVAIPNFSPDAQQEFVAGPAKSSIDAARQATSMLALGGLGAVMTLSIMRYWISGLSMQGSGGIEAFEGVSRSIMAVGLILLWPTAFRLCIALTNSATYTLLTWPSVRDDISGLWGWTAAITAGSFALGAPVAVVITIIVFVGFALMMLALVLMKIMLTAGTALIYVMMPLAVVLWPLPELSWIAKMTARAFVVCLIVPLTWTVVFITFAALGADFFTFSGTGNLLDRTIIQPLVAISMLAVAISLPRSLGRAAMLGAISSMGASSGGGGGAGFISRMGSSIAARRADAALSQFVPEGLGGQMQPASSGGGLQNAAQTALAGLRGVGGQGAASGGGGGGGRRGGGGGRRGGGGRNRGGGGRNQSGGGRNQSGGGRNQSGGGRNQSGGGRNQSGGPPGGGARPGGPNAGGGQPPRSSPGGGGAGARGGGSPPPSKAALQQGAEAWNQQGGPSEASVRGALDDLSGSQHAAVYADALTQSDSSFQDSMMSRATNPAHPSNVKSAYYTLGAAGREQVSSIAGGGGGGSAAPSNGGTPSPQPPTSAK